MLPGASPLPSVLTLPPIGNRDHRAGTQIAGGVAASAGGRKSVADRPRALLRRGNANTRFLKAPDTLS
jgi:hypothetical protein